MLGFLNTWAARGDRLSAEADAASPSFRAPAGGRITFEPGGQLEYSTEPRNTAAHALADLHALLRPLRADALAADVDLVALGLNPWLGLADVALQIASPRYLAMDEYFARTGPHGQRMMRLSAAMQVNLDLGDRATAGDRWRAAMLLSPVLRAAFANSAAEIGGAFVPGGRSVNWDLADPGRTGVSSLQSEAADSSPIDAYVRYALQAGVMMHPQDDGSLQTGPPGLTFERWMRGGYPTPSSVDAWRVHLGTLFPDVRPRGWIEVRTIDVPSEEWWGVPLLVLPALLYDDDALTELLATLEPLAPGLPELARRAPRIGLAEPSLGPITERVFRLALDSALGFTADYFDAGMVAATEEFMRRYVVRRRTQADDGGAPRTML